jgi:hypothetical protein
MIEVICNDCGKELDVSAREGLGDPVLYVDPCNCGCPTCETIEELRSKHKDEIEGLGDNIQRLEADKDGIEVELDIALDDIDDLKFTIEKLEDDK